MLFLIKEFSLFFISVEYSDEKNNLEEKYLNCNEKVVKYFYFPYLISITLNYTAMEEDCTPMMNFFQSLLMAFFNEKIILLLNKIFRKKW